MLGEFHAVYRRSRTFPGFNARKYLHFFQPEGIVNGYGMPFAALWRIGCYYHDIPQLNRNLYQRPDAGRHYTIIVGD
jgi:hypothetical protein